MPKPARIDQLVTDTPDARRAEAMARIWDPFVRLFHWSLVMSFAAAWLVSPEGNETLHFWAGYAATALVTMRLLWGIIGTRYARFTQFVRSPRVVLRYLRDVATGREARYLGHNPAGGMMILALLAGMLITATTGWMMTTDPYFGDDAMEELHEMAANGLLGLVLLHVVGVVLASIRHRENLIWAMVTGRKRSAKGRDVA